MKDKFVRIIEKLHDMLNNDSMKVVGWLNTPILTLDNKTALDCIAEGRIDVVESLLEEIESGFTF
jgi:uncharacterized protein (DUF2384 family)